ncbi:MAG: hypothetical protein IJA69_00945 [Clostridia bacterium]|nr:hypothetical protein [Clostridia bacterium]
MKIAIDIDKTLLECEGIAYKLAVGFERSGKKLKNKQKPLKFNEINTSKKVEQGFLKNIQKMLNVKYYHPMQNSVEVIKQWQQRGYELVFLSSKPSAYKAPLIEFLQKHKLTSIKTIIACNNKVKYCLLNNVDVLIDDKYSNCLSAKNAGIKSIMFRNDATEKTYKEFNDMQIVTSWNEINSIVEAMNNEKDTEQLDSCQGEGIEL